MPFLTRTVTGENDALAAFASQQLRQLATSLHGLTDEQLRAAPSASAMSLGAIARHVLFVSQKGLITQVDESYVPDVSGYTEAEWAAGGVLPEGVLESDTAESLAAELRTQADWISEILSSADLERPIRVPDQPWFPKDLESWPLRWVAFHAIEEYARHAGHADIIRESIDGKGAYELNDLADGVPVAG